LNPDPAFQVNPDSDTDPDKDLDSDTDPDKELDPYPIRTHGVDDKKYSRKNFFSLFLWSKIAND
jgi:hypothetical protein